MIITNNTLVENPDIFINGNYHDVLVKTRDLVYEGYVLLMHPLFASIRMMFSPIRSILLSNNKVAIPKNEISMELIGNALIKYEQLMKTRCPDFTHKDDYLYIDVELLRQAQLELTHFNAWR